ncbi:hypothetical protein ACIRON_11960 [Nocardioides sp. NPDC101246]|uniref:hypothetical protein n=1 Tax=Nocardioides sp. NPDC101246 TaxID=3364336 RepID=UPI0038122344
MRIKRHVRSTRIGVALAGTVMAIATSISLTPAPANAMYVDTASCPTLDGWVREQKWDSQRQAWRDHHKFYNYGYYNFSNEYGTRRIVNCQTGNAMAYLCYGYNGTNCTVPIYVHFTWEGSITPFNSIKLAP